MVSPSRMKLLGLTVSLSSSKDSKCSDIQQYIDQKGTEKLQAQLTLFPRSKQVVQGFSSWDSELFKVWLAFIGWSHISLLVDAALVIKEKELTELSVSLQYEIKDGTH